MTANRGPGGQPQPGDLKPANERMRMREPRERGLSYYRLVPLARPGDPSWDIAPNHGEVVVRARSAADARLVAAQAEWDAGELGRKPSHGASTRYASAFRNEQLYTAIRCDPPAEIAMEEGEARRGVVESS